MTRTNFCEFRNCETLCTQKKQEKGVLGEMVILEARGKQAWNGKKACLPPGCTPLPHSCPSGTNHSSAQMFWKIPSCPIIVSRELVILLKFTWAGYHCFLRQWGGMLKIFRGMSLFWELAPNKLFKLDLRAQQLWRQARRALSPMQEQDSFPP